MKKTLRIAVLECDFPMDSITAKCGSYGDMFETLLSAGMQSLDHDRDQVELRLSKYDVINSRDYPDPMTADAILLTGSRFSAYDELPWIMPLVKYLRHVYLESNIPLVGICFGHQLIARALGAKVGLNPHGWETAVDEFQLNETGSRIFGRQKLTLHQMHRDAVLSLPDGCQSLGSSPCCDIQGFFKPNRILTVQGHPEFDTFIMTQILDLRYGQGMFNKEEYDDGIARAGLSHDGIFVGGTICKFLMGRGL